MGLRSLAEEMTGADGARANTWHSVTFEDTHFDYGDHDTFTHSLPVLISYTPIAEIPKASDRQP